MCVHSRTFIIHFRHPLRAGYEQDQVIRTPGKPDQPVPIYWACKCVPALLCVSRVLVSSCHRVLTSMRVSLLIQLIRISFPPRARLETRQPPLCRVAQGQARYDG